MKKPFHHGKQWANQTLDWWLPDGQEQFNNTMQIKEYKDYFVQQNWHLPGVISYQFNSEGFRSPEFDSHADTVMALGCSFTMGIGLPESSTWPALVAKSLNMLHANFGWGGAAGDFCYRMAEYWIPTLKPKLVVLLNPPEGRMEFDIEPTGRTEELTPTNLTDNCFGNDQWLRFWYTNYENLWRHQRKNGNAIRGICAAYNIPYLEYTALKWMGKSREELGYARDRLHAGPIAQKTLAERIINDWQQTRIA